jgi:predicted DNA-binding transcriptional regulator YafY
MDTVRTTRAAARLITLAAILRGARRPLSAAELRERLAAVSDYDVTPRTIQRDLDRLEECGYPLYEEDQGDRVPLYGIYEHDLHWTAPLTTTLATTLVTLVTEALNINQRNPIQDQILQLALALKTVLPIELATQLDEALERRFSNPTPSNPLYARWMELILRAVTRKRTLVVEYEGAPGTIVSWTISPQEVITRGGEVLLSAHVAQLGESRLLDFENLRRVVEMPGVGDTDSTLPEPFGVTLILRGATAREALAVPCLADQKHQLLADGRLQVDGTFLDTAALKTWVLSKGAEAEVVSPAPLRAEIGQALAAAVQQYTLAPVTQRTRSRVVR